MSWPRSRSRYGCSPMSVCSRPDDVGVAAERELRVDELLVRRDPQLLQPRDRGLGERLVGEVGERGAAPQGEAALQRGGGGRRMAGGELAPAPVEEVLEAARVELLRRERSARSRGRGWPARIRRPRGPCAGARPARGACAAAVGGARSPQSASTIRSAGSTSFGWRSRSASSALRRLPPSATARPSSRTSRGPRMRNSMGVASPVVEQRYTRPRQRSQATVDLGVRAVRG